MTCPVCGRECPPNEYASYRRHEDCVAHPLSGPGYQPSTGRRISTSTVYADRSRKGEAAKPRSK